MSGLAGLAERLYDATGINLSYLYDPFDQARLLHGLLVTLELAGLTIVLSLVLGLAGACLLTSRSALLRVAVRGFVSVFRNTPPLVQIYFLYFGLGYLITAPVPGGGSAPLLSNMQWALLSLSLYAGAFNVEIFRSGIEAVPRGTAEAAAALGLSPLQGLRLVVLPIALRLCLPALGNNLVELIKTTNLAYAIAVPELMYNAKQIWGDSANVPEMMVTVLVAYLALTTSAAGLLGLLERRLALPGNGARA